jgi:hypothetical protein
MKHCGRNSLFSERRLSWSADALVREFAAFNFARMRASALPIVLI